MSSEARFSKHPPFPEDAPTIQLPRISLSKLSIGNSTESDLLFQACREHGFFMLDMRSSNNGRELVEDSERMFDLSLATLSLDKATLDMHAYKPPKDLLGYKPAGKLKTDDGKLDSTEMFTLGQDDIRGLCAPRSNPSPIESCRESCRAFFDHAGAVIETILNQLDVKLEVPRGTLASLCSLEKPSDTSLRMLLAHPTTQEISLGGHTDIGSITMLFNVLGGLQVLPASLANESGNWRFIRPEPGCALINIGDTLVEWSGGVLRSSLHRVVRPPGEQGTVTRQSLAYLVRPAREATIARLESPLIPQLADKGKLDAQPVSEWAATRAMQIIKGELRPRTIGGGPLATELEWPREDSRWQSNSSH